jgi:hypothetical protein
MTNKSKIKGDNNSVFQGIKKSNIDIKSTNGKNNNYVIIGIIIAILTLLTTVIIGWDNIEKFFVK